MSRIFGFFIIFASLAASAADLNWTGGYRLESSFIKNNNLVGSGQQEKEYFNHHLVLRPQMIVGDGITVRSKFDIFNGQNLGSQFGQFFGNNSTAGANTNSGATGTVPSETLQVNELYLTWTQGFGSFIGGRAPVQFGLGLTHNAGTGEFDHWFDVKDLVGYKVVFGNFYIFPMLAKIREDRTDIDDDINDFMVEFMYENLDTDLTLGLFYQSRASTNSGNDLLAASPYGGNTKASELDVKDFNFYVAKKLGNLSFAIETGYQSGNTGITNGVGGEEVIIEGFAVAGDLNYKAPGSAWDWNLKAGSVSGNDSSSASKYEGYLADRNYDVGMLLFNYSMGGGDILGTGSFTNLEVNKNVDVEFLSNAIYISPGTHWKWNDKWGMNGRFVYAMLSKEQFVGGGKDLGMELDLGTYYRPHERLTLKLDAGVLFPGSAFEAGAMGLESETAFGVITKAAVSF